MRTTQAKIKGSVDFLWAADPKKIHSLFDLQPKEGNLSELSPTGIALLDTVASLTPAIALYESLGFVAIDAYRYNPRPDARYFALDL